jgi:hypothetical protein
MVLPPDLIDAIKQRAEELSLTTTAYITHLVRKDLGLPVALESQLEERVKLLEKRLDCLQGEDPAT